MISRDGVEYLAGRALYSNSRSRDEHFLIFSGRIMNRKTENTSTFNDQTVDKKMLEATERKGAIYRSVTLQKNGTYIVRYICVS